MPIPISNININVNININININVNINQHQKTWGPTDSGGVAEGTFDIRVGHSLVDVVGKTVVLHDSTGKRLSCSVLALNDAETMAPMTVGYHLQGLETEATGGLHIHSGTSCQDTASQGGHYYSTEVYPDPTTEPWTATTYTTGANGQAHGSFRVLPGVSMASVAINTKATGTNKVLVLHNSAGVRIACGVLKSQAQQGMLANSGNPAGDAVTGPACGASKDTNSVELLDAECVAVGSIGNTGLLTGAKSSAAGTSAFVSGVLSDPFLSLNGINSVVGRSIVISNSNGFALGTCVVGRGYETTVAGKLILHAPLFMFVHYYY